MKRTFLLVLWAIPSLCMERTLSLEHFAEGLRLGNAQVVQLYITQVQTGMVAVNTADGYEGRTALMNAAIYNRVEAIKELLKIPDINVNAKDRDGTIALMHAARNNSIGAIKELLRVPGSNLNATDKSNNTALMLGVMHNAVEAVKELLKVPGIDANARNKGGSTALMEAASDTRVEITKELLKVPGIEVNKKNNGGNTALMIAVMHNGVEVVQELLKVPDIDANARNNFGKTALKYAIERKNITIAQFLWAAGADDTGITLDLEMQKVKEEGRAVFNGILTALRNGDAESLRKYQDQGYRTIINERAIAASEGPKRKGESLESGKRKKARTEKPVQASNGTLVQREVDPAPRVVLDDAQHLPERETRAEVQREVHSMAPTLIDSSVPIRNGESLLLDEERLTVSREQAARDAQPRPTTLREVIDFIDVTARVNGESALHHLLLAGNDIVIRLLDRGADVDAQNKDGHTALMLAVFEKSEGLVKMLLERGANVNIQNKKGETALILAARTGLMHLIAPLLERTDFSLTDETGRTFLDYLPEDLKMFFIAISKRKQ